jgi:hypothetical protein
MERFPPLSGVLDVNPKRPHTRAGEPGSSLKFHAWSNVNLREGRRLLGGCLSLVRIRTYKQREVVVRFMRPFKHRSGVFLRTRFLAKLRPLFRIAMEAVCPKNPTLLCLARLKQAPKMEMEE